MISYKGLKEKLIKSDMFINNKFLDMYIDTVIKNIDTPNQKNITQKHHILPKHYFIHRNLIVDNSKENLINLPIYDHIRVHYYLYNCAKDTNEKYSNLYALRKMVGGDFKDLNKIEVLDNEACLDLYQKYNQYNKEIHLGTTHITSDETKRKISNSKKDKYHDYKTIHDDEGNEKRIPEKELQYYLDGGWVLGRCEKSVQSLKRGYNYDSKGMLGKTQSDYQKEQVRKALAGKQKSDNAKQNMSQARLGKKLYINPITGKGKYLSSDEIKEYESNGWYKK